MLIGLISFAFYLSIGVYSLSIGVRSWLNRIFFLACLVCAHWAVSYGFMHSSHTMIEVEFWYDVSAPGWCFISSFALHYALLLTGKKEFVHRWLVLLAMYCPGFIFFFLEITGELGSRGFVNVGYGYSEIPPLDNISFWFFNIFMIGYVVIGMILIAYWGIKSSIKRERMQTLVLLSTTLGAVIIGFVNDIIMPALAFPIAPSIAPIAILVWISGMGISIARYQLMTISMTYASDEIVSQISDILILIDGKGKIIKVNNKMKEVLGYGKSIYGTDVKRFIRDGEMFSYRIKELQKRSGGSDFFEAEFAQSRGEWIPVNITTSVLRDRFDDVIAVLIVAHDIREKHALRSEVHERRAVEERLRLRNDDLEKDLSNARIIQQALIFDKMPDLPGFKVGFRQLTMEAVGGDYFSLYEFSENRLAVFIGDVSGHGISAALFLSLLKSVSEGLLKEFGDEPEVFLEELNKKLLGNIPYSFISVIYGIFEKTGEDTATFTFSKGGHPEPVVYRNQSGEVEFLECKGPVIGIFKNTRFSLATVTLERGDRIYLYTDGIPETRNSEKMLNFSGFQSLLEGTRGLELSDSLDFIVNKTDEFRGDFPVEDDIVIVAVEVL